MSQMNPSTQTKTQDDYNKKWASDYAKTPVHGWSVWKDWKVTTWSQTWNDQGKDAVKK